MIKRDKNDVFRFASLQGSTALELLHKDDLKAIDTIIYISGDQTYRESTASLRSIAKLGGIYKLAIVLLIFPKFIRNWVYQVISRNRYKWFGKLDSCRVPSEDDLGKILP